MGYYDPPNDYPEFFELSKTKSKAKKEYKCSACSQMIKIGEVHHKYVMLDEDNKLISSKFHLICPWEEGSP